MHFTEEAEEILESLWTAQEKNRGNNEIALSGLREKPSTDTLTELTKNKVIEQISENRIRLTESGLVYARDAIRRHRLAERLLTDVLAVKSSLIHEAACQFEHHLHKGIDTNVCTLLGHPKFCPHGQPIPLGTCCEERSKLISPVVVKLSEIKPGNGGEIAYLHTTDPKRAQMLLSMGLVPGVSIKLLTSFPSLLFQLGEGQFAVDKSIAGDVYVRMMVN